MFPSFEDFMEKLYLINPVGNATIYYDSVINLLESGEKLYDGSLVTFDILIKRYSDYMAYLKPFNDVKDKQFIKKDKIPKGVGEYIILKLYKDDYSKQNGSSNDFYLFGI